MPTDTELLTPAEAAVIAAVTVRDINRLIDEKILPDRLYTLDGGRRLHAAACPMAGFYFRAAKELTPDERALVIHQLYARQEKSLRPDDWIVHHDFLTVNLEGFVADAQERHAKLAEARKMVVEDPDILGGTPVICSTRIPVYDVAASMAAGLSRERIRAAWPGLDDRMIELAVIYAVANPPRGRPRRPAPPSAAQNMSERRVERRSRA